ncbi:MAG: uroporphyrinogen-III C-methyltransferase [Prochlorococcus sp. SP3034]|nr:uroporphyrinogen-III C-methyltransferase [Prochlorococcus sp. SP3034]
MGIVYLVGSGPGDPELITLKALRLIKSCDALVHDALIPPEIVKEASPNCEVIHVGKRSGCSSFLQKDINQLLFKLSQQGKNVVRLKGGDPFVFARGGEEVSFLEQKGVQIEIVPGITSGIAAPSYIGIPLTHRNGASSVTFVTGHEQADKKEKTVKWRELAKSSDSLVIYMGIRNVGYIVNELLAGGRDPNTASAVVQEATLKNQKSEITKLSNLVEIIKVNQFKSPSIILIGKIVEFQVNNYVTKLSDAKLAENKKF